MYEFLNNPQWSIITYSDIWNKLEYLETGTLDWHRKWSDNNPQLKRVSKEAKNIFAISSIKKMDIWGGSVKSGNGWYFQFVHEF